jgi:hypothetical protein
MISYPIYKVIHLIGIMMIFLSLGGAATYIINGGTKNHKWSKAVAITHGTGLLLALIGGFGLLARLGITHGGLPVWAIAKIGIWFILAIMTGAITRKPDFARPMWTIIIILGATAAYLAGSKPF